MAKFPEPPGIQALSQIPPKIITFQAQTLLWRVYRSGGEFPTRWNTFRHYGPTAARFDHHLTNPTGQSYQQERGIMYLAEQGPTCIAEVFQTTRVIDRHNGAPWMVAFTLERDITLLDLTGVFVTTLGASTAIHSGPRPRAQRWSQQLYMAYPQIEGLLYCSSMFGNAPSLALFERARSALPERPAFHRSLSDNGLLSHLAQTGKLIGYPLV